MNKEQHKRIVRRGDALNLAYLFDEADIEPIELEYAMARGTYKISVERIHGLQGGDKQ